MQEKYAPIKTDCPMENERIRIRRLNAANDANILGAETDTVQMARTACFVCTRGGGKILLNGMEHTVESGSLIVYFSYSVLHIISKTHDLEGILISCNLETIQPLLYKVSDFNSLFLIRKHPYTKLKEWQVKMITDYIELFSGILRHIKTEEQARLEAQIQPIRETMRQQIDLLAGHRLLLHQLAPEDRVTQPQGRRPAEVHHHALPLLQDRTRREVLRNSAMSDEPILLGHHKGEEWQGTKRMDYGSTAGRIETHAQLYKQNHKGNIGGTALPQPVLLRQVVQKPRWMQPFGIQKREKGNRTALSRICSHRRTTP